MKKYFSFIDEIFKIPFVSGAAVVTDRISIDGFPILYAYREEEKFPNDSGWRFFSGDEDESYLEIPSNSCIFLLNTVVNHDPTIIPLLSFPGFGSFERAVGGNFTLVND